MKLLRAWEFNNIGGSNLLLLHSLLSCYTGLYLGFHWYLPDNPISQVTHPLSRCICDNLKTMSPSLPPNHKWSYGITEILLPLSSWVYLYFYLHSGWFCYHSYNFCWLSTKLLNSDFVTASSFETSAMTSENTLLIFHSCLHLNFIWSWFSVNVVSKC